MTVFTSEGIAEQILKPAIANERIALQIKKDVPSAGLIQLGQPKPWDWL